MIYYTVRLNKLECRVFVDKQDAEEFKNYFSALTGRTDIYVIERRTKENVERKETLT